tara:strand:- start:2399 stop:2767 length:369 start_codon:yes stop_codon:yes gene_type:complete
MRDLKDIIRRAIKNGFDLSFVNVYNERKITQDLYDFLVNQKYFCSMEDNVIYVGPEIVEDVAKITIKNKVMYVKPLTHEGFFDTLVTLFKYIQFLSNNQEEDPQEDISTEDYDDDSSEEIWL